MLRRLGATAAIALAIAFCLLMPAGALATATEFGNRCAGNATAPDRTILGQDNGVRDGSFSNNVGPWELRGSKDAVITRWKVQVGPGLSPPPQQLVAWRYSGEESALNLGESAFESLHEGSNEFTTRIPVPEYAHIGLRGQGETLYCDESESSFVGVVAGDFPVGASRDFETQHPKGAPAVAIAEPDFDSDGYGDETQDQCNFQAWTHGPCEYFGILVPNRRVTRQAIWVELESTMAGTAATGVTVSLPRRKGGTRTVQFAPMTVALAARATVTVRLPIPRGVKRYLAKLPRSKGIRAELEVIGTSEHGNEARAIRRFKLKGLSTLSKGRGGS